MTEHETFQKLILALEEAASRSKELGIFRPDTAYAWDKVAKQITETRDLIYNLAMQRMN